MINSLNESCFTLHVNGKCNLLSDFFGIDLSDIEKITTLSSLFPDELTAFSKMGKFANEVTKTVNLKQLETKFNPDFFPSLPKDEISDDYAISLLIAEDEALQQNTETETFIVISKNFDSLGDHVCAKIKFETESRNLSIEGKVLISPAIFAQYKQHISQNAPVMVSH